MPESYPLLLPEQQIQNVRYPKALHVQLLVPFRVRRLLGYLGSHTAREFQTMIGSTVPSSNFSHHIVGATASYNSITLPYLQCHRVYILCFPLTLQHSVSPNPIFALSSRTSGQQNGIRS